MSKNRFTPTDRPIHCFPTELQVTSSVLLHEHDSHEFFYCRSGAGFQHTEHGTYEMQPGELYFFPAGQSHIASRSGQDFCRAFVVNLHEKSFLADVGRDEVAHRVLPYLTERTRAGEPRISLPPTVARKIGGLFDRMIRETQQQPAGYAGAVRVYMIEALLAILRAPDVLDSLCEHFRPSPARERLREVLHYIETNYMNSLDVEKMARLACISRSHFHAVFRKETGQTLVEYVNGVRIRAAMKQLRKTDPSILVVAQNCGFSSLSHFYHCFKALTGQTPKEYMRGSTR